MSGTRRGDRQIYGCACRYGAAGRVGDRGTVWRMSGSMCSTPVVVPGLIAWKCWRHIAATLEAQGEEALLWSGSETRCERACVRLPKYCRLRSSSAHTCSWGLAVWQNSGVRRWRMRKTSAQPSI